MYVLDHRTTAHATPMILRGLGSLFNEGRATRIRDTEASEPARVLTTRLHCCRQWSTDMDKILQVDQL